MVLVDAAAHSEQEILHRCHIWPGSVQRSMDVINEMISEKINVRKVARIEDL
jgi:hypothetical protein